MATSSEFDKVPDGYPKLAALLAKEHEYMIVRKFNRLNARNLLYYQSELTAVEEQLGLLDSQLSNDGATDELRSWPTFATDNKRRNLVMKMRKLLREYSQSGARSYSEPTVDST
jgi:hypothetical protein